MAKRFSGQHFMAFRPKNNFFVLFEKVKFVYYSRPKSFQQRSKSFPGTDYLRFRSADPIIPRYEGHFLACVTETKHYCRTKTNTLTFILNMVYKSEKFSRQLCVRFEQSKQAVDLQRRFILGTFYHLFF